MEKLIGRKNEIKELERCMNSQRSEFIVVYGRRRIGKTFLINTFFKDKITFGFTGSHKATKKRQLEMFSQSLLQAGKKLSKQPLELSNWAQAFDELKLLLSRRQSSKKVIFFDEMPWIDRNRNDFVTALEDFWNGWAASRDDIVLIATGSATSWMVNNILKNQGGLYNRVTRKIHLRPFTLVECEEYLRAHNCRWDRYAIAQYYMYLGGVPYYLSLLSYDRSLEENVYNFFFSSHSLLENEFGDLYSVLFTRADKYIAVVKLLANHREGLSRNEIATSVSDGGSLSHILNNLILCDFVTAYKQFGNKKKGMIYRLTDFYTLFYLKFVENTGVKTNSNYWNLMLSKPSVMAWQGLTYEIVVLTHIEQIKRSLGISGILTDEFAWRSTEAVTVAPGKTRRAQIDLVIDRDDRNIHLCEIKFSQERFVIDKNYELSLREKMTVFREQTKTKKALLVTFITTYGVKQNTHSGIVALELTLDNLFE